MDNKDVEESMGCR